MSPAAGVKCFHLEIITTWWSYQMEAFSALLAFVRGLHRSPVNSSHKGQWRGALMFSLIWPWINRWVNTREAGDLRRRRAHYDVIVMNLFVMAQWYAGIFRYDDVNQMSCADFAAPLSVLNRKPVHWKGIAKYTNMFIKISNNQMFRNIFGDGLFSGAIPLKRINYYPRIEK